MDRKKLDGHLEEVRRNVERIREEHHERFNRLLDRRGRMFSTIPVNKPPSSVPKRRPPS